ncbi:unnamed protein product [Rhodiola kirilowii]
MEEADEPHLQPVSVEKQVPSMVTISDRVLSDLSVFPPVNHEGLHISSSYHSQPKSSPHSSSSPYHSSSSSSFSSSTSISLDSDQSDEFADSFLPLDSTKESGLYHDCINPTLGFHSTLTISSCRWLRFGLEIFRRKILNSTSSIPGFGALVAAFRLFPLMTSVASVYVASLVIIWFRRRRNRQLSINLLMGVIREQDEKIVKLLDQIARLDQVLLGYQRP